MRTLTLPAMNRVSQISGSSASPAANILQASVQTFFSGINWDGHLPSIGSSGLASGAMVDEPPNLEMSVTRFFATFSWEGHAIAASPVIKTPESEQQEFTLDAFSDLF